jgi:hypothetical protein
MLCTVTMMLEAHAQLAETAAFVLRLHVICFHASLHISRQASAAYWQHDAPAE